MEQALYKVTSAMKKLDVCRATIYRLLNRGQLEAVKIGSTTRITAASIERLITSSGKR
ncbi:helix-turn-helix domain-containing protein [Massilia brevitalea]|uniref:helix-turn-helix domain-containing protein n=1 Tax=Massilia brevitalea TaxID=442526 RepID=UPI00273833AC|nr:helix-turn-helix domain-containing protein [Massilia brevitalea]